MICAAPRRDEGHVHVNGCSAPQGSTPAEDLVPAAVGVGVPLFRVSDSSFILLRVSVGLVWRNPLVNTHTYSAVWKPTTFALKMLDYALMQNRA